MEGRVPLAVGFIALCLAGGCTTGSEAEDSGGAGDGDGDGDGGSGNEDAHALASAYELVCKANCECPDSPWMDEANCKLSCEGSAAQLEASLGDNSNAPCSEIGMIADAIASCAVESCGADRDECLGAHYLELYECWPPDDYSYSDSASDPASDVALRGELAGALLFGAAPLSENARDRPSD